MTADGPPGLRKMPRRLIQIIPRFRPDADGLGEFALCLGDALWRQCKVPSDFVVWSPPRPSPELPVPGSDQFPHSILRGTNGQKSDFVRALRQAAAASERPVALLHFTPYAYSREGIAWWLPGMLRQFVNSGLRLVCFFHESYAASIFPTKTWLTSGWQRRIFRDVLNLSAAAVSSNTNYLRQMAQENRMGRPLALAGICSNVGEAAALPAPADRSQRLVIFGQHPSRERLYEQHLPLLLRVAAHLQIEEVADIGPAGDWLPLRRQVSEALARQGISFHAHGPLPPSAVGEILGHSFAGAVNYTAGLEYKSGIVGAYQAYGLPVVRFSPAGEAETSPGDPACLTPHLLLSCPARSEALTALLATSAQAGFDFYRENRSYDTVLRQLMPWIAEP